LTPLLLILLLRSTSLLQAETNSFETLYDAVYRELAILHPGSAKLAPKALKIAKRAADSSLDDEKKVEALYDLLAEETSGKDKEIGLSIHRILAKADLKGVRTATLSIATQAGTEPTNSLPNYKIINVAGAVTNQVIVHASTNLSGLGTNALAKLTIVNVRDGKTNGVPSEHVITNREDTVIINKIALAPLTNFNSFFHFGAYVLNPYQIIGTNHMVVKGNTDANAFLELVYNNRWAWNSERYLNAEPGAGWLWQFRPRCNPLTIFGSGYDFQGRLSYTFARSDQPSASTIVGSGDVAAEWTLAKHLWREHTETHAQSLNLEISYGAVSDRNDFDIHHRGFVGLGYVGSVPERILDNGRNIQLALRFGWASIEHVDFTTNTATSEVNFKYTVPDYRSSWGPALETEAYFPVLEQSFLTLGGRFYGNADPNVWSMWIGFTTPISKIGSVIPK